jgi:putative addiction module killer protein
VYEIKEYVTETNKNPFAEWFKGLRDKKVKNKIIVRVRRVSFGNLGNWRRLENAQGVCEMREHSGAGYRIYFGFVGKTVILLLAGSDKGNQDRVIAKAKQYWNDYQRGEKNRGNK